MSTQLIHCPVCQAANEVGRERCSACQAMLSAEIGVSSEAPLDTLPPRQRQKRVGLQFSRRRRKLLLAGLATGGVLVGGGGLASYLVNHFSSAQTIWEGETVELIDISQAVWSSGGRYLAALGMDVSQQVGVMLWDIQLQKYIWFHSFPYHAQAPVPIQALAWSPDGQSFVIAEGVYLSLWSVSRQSGDHILQKLIIYPNGETFSMSDKGLADVTLSAVLWSADGRYLAYVVDMTVCIWDTQTRKLLRTYQGHTKETSTSTFGLALSWSPDGQYIASYAQGEQSVTSLMHIWQVRDGATLALVQTSQLDASQDIASWVQWSPNSRYLTYGSRGTWLNAYDVQSKKRFTLLVDQSMPSSRISVLPQMASWSPDGKYLAIISNAAGQGFIELFQPTDDDFRPASTDGQSIWRWPVSNAVTGVSWSPNRRSLVAICYHNDTSYTIHFYDPFTQKQRAWADIFGALSSLAWSPDGRYLAVWAHDFSTSRMIIHVYNE